MTVRARADTSRVLSVRPESVGEARHTVIGLPLPQTTRDVLALLASELMTNCVLHAGLTADDVVKLRVSESPGCIRLAIHDGGGGFAAAPRPEPEPTLVVGGRGLTIVAELADDWGIDIDADGCTVWCELEVEDEPMVSADHDVRKGYVRELAQHLVTRAPFPSSAT
jgi:anti-sigma regulatory factor (Ser/Thr protein kinase)